jgi:Xaa-Pro aminopeptidase
MRYQQIDSVFFIHNRKNLVSQLKKNSVVVVNANDIMPTNADGTMRFRQNSDLFYFTGVEQEETILVLCPDFPDKKYREVLFLRETNETIATWEGHKLTKKEARDLTGIQTVLWVSEFPKLFNTMMVMGDVVHVYLNTNDHYRADVPIESRDLRFIKWCQQKYPLHKYERLAPILHNLRTIKSKHEIRMLQTACDITEKAFRRVLGFVKPGVMEYAIEAEYAHEFLRNGSRGFAYEPIIASGANSCVLHYIDNDKACEDGGVLLLDVGAEYANYNADLTRTIPVNGRFNKRQKEVYNSVLRVMHAAMKLLKAGVVYYDYHKEVQKIMESELIRLKLIDKKDVKNQSREKPLF